MSELYYPEESVTGYYLTGIAEGLASSFPVSVICSQSTYASRGLNALRYEQRNGVEIYRCWSNTFSKRQMVIRPDDPQERAAAILALKADPARLGEMGRRARQAAEAKYAEPLIIEKYKTALADHLQSTESTRRGI